MSRFKESTDDLAKLVIVRAMYYVMLTILLGSPSVMGREGALPGAGRQEKTTVQEKTLNEALQKLDQEFDSCFAWWGEIYDPKSGGFYYSLSSKKSTSFAPFIEATSKAVNVLHWTGILEQTSPEFRAGIVAYFQERQDPESGFFCDPEYRKSYDAHTRSRALGMARTSLKRCGGKPLHVLPDKRVGTSAEAKRHYAHLESSTTLRAWLKKLPWETRAWTAGARILSQNGAFQTLPVPKRRELLKTLHEFVETKQKENGLFGSSEDHWFSRLSGTYKICSFFEKNGLPLPRVPEMTVTVMTFLEKKDYQNLIVLYNTVNLLGILHRSGNGFTLDRRLHILERATKIIGKFRASDGGFFTRIGQTSPKANKFLLAEDVVESNTNATGLAHKTRGLLYTLVTGEPMPHPHRRSGDFLKALAGKTVIRQ